MFMSLAPRVTLICSDGQYRYMDTNKFLKQTNVMTSESNKQSKNQCYIICKHTTGRGQSHIYSQTGLHDFIQNVSADQEGQKGTDDVRLSV